MKTLLWKRKWVRNFLLLRKWKEKPLSSVQFSSAAQNFPGGSDGKVSVYNVGDLGSIPGLERFSGEGNGNPLQYSCLENSMDVGARCPWGHKESDTTERLHFHFLGVRKYFSFILLQVVDQFSQHHLLKRLSLIHCILLPPLLKIRCPYVCGFISGLSILFHWSIFLSLCQYHTVLMTVAL